MSCMCMANPSLAQSCWLPLVKGIRVLSGFADFFRPVRIRLQLFQPLALEIALSIGCYTMLYNQGRESRIWGRGQWAVDIH